MRTGYFIPENTRQQIAIECLDRRTTHQEIADKHGVSLHSVSRIAKEHGIPPRPKGGYTEPEDLAYRGGWVRDGLVWRPVRGEAS